MGRGSGDGAFEEEEPDALRREELRLISMTGPSDVRDTIETFSC